MGFTRKYWDQMLVTHDVANWLESIQRAGVLKETFPALQAMVGFGGKGHKDLWAHTKQVVAQTVPDAILRWASLFHDVGKPVSFSEDNGKVTFWDHEAASARLWRESARASQLFLDQEIRRVRIILYNLGRVECYLASWTDSAVRRLSTDLGDHLEDVFAVARADCTTARPEMRRKVLADTKALKDRIEKIRIQDEIPQALPAGLGNALMARLGLKPGRELGAILDALKVRVEAGELPRNAPHEIYLKSLEKS